MNLLFLNHEKSQCGVYNYGVRLYDIWKKSENITFTYKEINTLDDYNVIVFDDYKYILYNYHPTTMKWLSSDTITNNTINIGILHECSPNMFHYCINTQSDITRPIFTDIPISIISTNDNIIHFLNYGMDSNIPIIGSFGFGFTNKGFDKIIKYTNEQYDEAIVKIIMPYSEFGDKTGEISRQISKLCNNLEIKPTIKVMIIHDFLDDNDILHFLSKNTINVFLYDYMYGRGISSAIDFALSVDTPLAISDSYMFRHIYDDSICLYKTLFQDCMSNSIPIIKKYRDIYSHKNSIEFIENYI